MSSAMMSEEDMFHFNSSSIQIPKVNGKHSKHLQHVSLKAEGETLSQGNGVGRKICANIPMYREVFPGLESWITSKVSSWINLEGHSIQWLCVVCLDRRGYSLSYLSIYSIFSDSILA